ncbi:MAG TPA: GtrA family protein [Clostridiaceae bacterium]
MYWVYYTGGIYIIRFTKYKQQIMYLIFGGLTTIVNIIIYSVFTRVFSFGTIESNVIAWVASVLFAYITNKLFVFHSKSLNMLTIVKELTAFISCRLFSGIMDMSIMFIFVNLLDFNDIVIKIISNIFVIIVNYFLSKLVIFKNNN